MDKDKRDKAEELQQEEQDITAFFKENKKSGEKAAKYAETGKIIDDLIHSDTQAENADDLLDNMPALQAVLNIRNSSGFKNIESLANRVYKQTQPLRDSLESFTQLSDQLRDFTRLELAALNSTESLQQYHQLIQKIADEAQKRADEARELEELTPYINKELEKPVYQGKSLEELAAEAKDENGKQLPDSLYEKAISAAVAARKEAKAAEVIPVLQSAGKPTNYLTPNTKLSNELLGTGKSGELIGAGKQELTVFKNVPIYVMASINGMDDVKQTMGKNYSEYDDAVYSACLSLWDLLNRNNLPKVITPGQIYRVMTNKSNDDKVQPQQEEAVAESFEKLRHIFVKGDITEHLKAINKKTPISYQGRPVDEYDNIYIDGHLIEAKGCPARVGRKVVNGWRIDGTPILLEYAQMVNQLVSIPIDLLDIKKISKKGEISTVSIPMTKPRIAVRNYLQRRILQLKHDSKQAADSLRKYETRKEKHTDKAMPEKAIGDFYRIHHTILLQSVYDAAEIKAANTKTRTTEFVIECMDFWKAKGWISGYTKRKRKGRKGIEAINIKI